MIILCHASNSKAVPCNCAHHSNCYIFKPSIGLQFDVIIDKKNFQEIREINTKFLHLKMYTNRNIKFVCMYLKVLVNIHTHLLITPSSHLGWLVCECMHTHTHTHSHTNTQTHTHTHTHTHTLTLTHTHTQTHTHTHTSHTHAAAHMVCNIMYISSHLTL